ncbi:MAG: DUF6261 family protein [Dysgonamonadaceae bacterium]|jgi:hypothetical protein|nr:DUF6261 family protein [Dysgonamonadaceae bacterium]
MELHEINLKIMPADPLIEFGQEVENRILPIGSMARYIEPAYSQFLQWHRKGIELREISRKNHLTKEIELQEVKTEHDYSDILALAAIAEHSGDTAKAQYAKALIEAMKPFKGLTKKDRQTRIGELIVITKLFTEQYLSNIISIGAETQYNALKSDLNILQTLIATRGHEEAVKPGYTFTDVKKGENESFAAMRTIINGIINAGEYPDVNARLQIIEIATDLNQRIDYYRNAYEPKRQGIDLNSPQATIEIITPLPLAIPAGTEGQVLIKVRFKTGDPAIGTVELREGYDYIKRYEDNIAPNPNAKVIAHGAGKYKGEKSATFEIRVIH